MVIYHGRIYKKSPTKQIQAYAVHFEQHGKKWPLFLKLVLLQIWELVSQSVLRNKQSNNSPNLLDKEKSMVWKIQLLEPQDSLFPGFHASWGC